MVRCKSEADLSRIEVAGQRCRHAAADGNAETRNHQRGADADALIGFFHAVIRAEEPQAILQDVAAEVRAKVVLLADVADCGAGRRKGALVLRIRQKASTSL